MTRTTKPKPATLPAFAAPAIPPADVLGRLAALKTAATPALKQQWRELFGTEPPPYNRRFLESRLAYRIQELAYGGLNFRHDPQKKAGTGEVAGHLHPAALLVRRERGIRRPCFATDGKRMIMPSFGVMTGGLDLRHKAFAGLFEKTELVAHMLGQGRVHSISYGRLSG